jgi:hypothetical protein
MAHFVTPTGLVGFGKDANCTLDLCSVEYSVFEYLPSLPANSVFLALFALSGFIHVYQGIRSRQWFYMWATVLGCITEVIGYAGRIELHSNPFNFNYFLIQISELPTLVPFVAYMKLIYIVCLTIAPAFFSAAIYVTLSKM